MSTKLSLGLDTSNYTTSAALTGPGGIIIASETVLLKVKAGERGLRQSEALFQHWHNLPRILESMLKDFGDLIGSVAASTRPRPAKGSYMPVFGAGEVVARIIAAQSGAKLCFCSHQEGHMLAAALRKDVDLNAPLLFAHLSGGTLELVYKKGGEYRVCAGTLDISYGQLLDRFGVASGFAFPAGRAVDELACAFDGEGIKNPLAEPAIKGGYVNLSGMENSLERARKDWGRDALAYFLMDRVSGSFIKLCEAAMEETGAGKVLVSGGVACSDFLRMRCADERFVFADKKLCGDNAVGVSIYGGMNCL